VIVIEAGVVASSWMTVILLGSGTIPEPYSVAGTPS
jgi:hypothetical protein